MSKRTINRHTWSHLLQNIDVDPSANLQSSDGLLKCLTDTHSTSRIPQSLQQSESSGIEPSVDYVYDIDDPTIPMSEIFMEMPEEPCSMEDFFNQFENVLPEDCEKLKSDDPGLSVADELLQFFILFNISNRAMQYLLNMLCRLGLQNCPSSLYHLLKKQREKMQQLDVTRKDRFLYVGLKNNLKYLIEKSLIAFEAFSTVDLKLQINFDGLPLYRSSPINLWPILLKIDGVDSPLPVGLFCGIGKPNLDIFLADLSCELRSLLTDGIIIEKTIFKTKSDDIVFVCDAPARAYFQGIKGHNAFEGCGYCRQVGFRYNDSTVFQSCAEVARSDTLYADYGESNQVRITPLSPFVPLRRNFPPDYMHCVLLGVTRKLLNFYFNSVKGLRLPCKLSANQQVCLNSHVEKLKHFLPREFQRRLRRFTELQHFKACEFRTYLLYFCPVLFKNVLPDRYFRHLLLLHFAIYVLCSRTLSDFYAHANSCLEVFVHEMSKLFGSCSVVYNVHCLLHLHEYVELYGTLDSFSAFRYENYLGVLKRRIKATSNIFQHSFNQLISVREFYPSLSQPTTLYFSNTSPNNCANLGHGIFVLIADVSGSFVSGYQLKFVKCLYDEPYPSSLLGMGYYKKTTNFIRYKEPMSKAICITSNEACDEYIVLPYVIQ